MSYKFFLGIGLILCILCFCFLVSGKTESSVTPIKEQVQRAFSQAMDGDLAAAADSIKTAARLWNHKRNRLAAISDHNPIDDIDILLCQLPVTGSKSDFLTNCRKLMLLLQSVVDDHKLHWWNFLSSVLFGNHLHTLW